MFVIATSNQEKLAWGRETAHLQWSKYKMNRKLFRILELQCSTSHPHTVNIKIGTSGGKLLACAGWSSSTVMHQASESSAQWDQSASKSSGNILFKESAGPNFSKTRYSNNIFHFHSDLYIFTISSCRPRVNVHCACITVPSWIVNWLQRATCGKYMWAKV